MKNWITLFFLGCSTLFFAQNSVVINGEIFVADAKPSEVHIINLTTQEEAISDEDGKFTIAVHLDDLLVFSANHLDYMRKIVEQENLNSKQIRIEMTSKSTMLDEVEIVNYSRINAVDLGILSKPAKKYTVAERRLYGATSSPLDGLINTLSGRKAMLKNDVQTEKKQMALEKLDLLYDEKFYTETMRLQPDDIGGFKYYVVEDFKLREALNGKNTFFVTFLMIKLATDYKAIRDAK